MAIAKNPNRKPSKTTDRKAAAFISGAGVKPAEAAVRENRKPTQIRIPPDLLVRFDQGAKRLGVSRASFLVMAGVEKLERMDQ